MLKMNKETTRGWNIKLPAQEFLALHAANMSSEVLASHDPLTNNTARQQKASEAAMKRHNPRVILFHDPGDAINPHDVLESRPGDIFTVAIPALFMPNGHSPWQSLGPQPALAAQTYALGVNKEAVNVVFASDRGVYADRLMDALGLSADAAPDARVTETERQIHTKAVNIAAENGITGANDIRTILQLAVLQHNLRAAAQTAATTVADAKTLGVFHATQTGRLVKVGQDDNLMDAYARAQSRGLGGIMDRARNTMRCDAPAAADKEKDIAVFCCCDARAQCHHAFGSDRITSYASVGVFIPPYGQYPDHPTYAFIDQAWQDGVRTFTVLGHEDCGGIKALVEQRLAQRSGKKKTHGAVIDTYLSQASSVIDNALDFVGALQAGGEKIAKKQIYDLAAKEVKKWSARNVANHAASKGYRDAGVLTYFLEIGTRNIQALDMNEPIDDTWARMRGVKPTEYLHKVGDITPLAAPFQPRHGHSTPVLHWLGL
ncbi:MAG: hypothetical protein KGI37_09835 [Alphaproteobacteria bacterium]|nr:hypothetical protein [Alphaproteobacteria bacterium]